MAASRFSSEADDRYQAFVRHGALCLELHRPGQFAWTEARMYRYRDFVLDAIVDRQAGGAGFVLRLVDQGSFVSILIGDTGIRMDVFLNGEPRTLVPPIACPWLEGRSRLAISIVARGNHYFVLLDGRIALEAQDDTIDAGMIGFAAMSGNQTCTASLQALSVESRPFEVELAHFRYAELAARFPDQRRRLARAYFVNQDYLATLIQLKRIRSTASIKPGVPVPASWQQRLRRHLLLRHHRRQLRRNGQSVTDGQSSSVLLSNLDIAGDWFLEAECHIRLGLLDEAERALDECLALVPDMPEAIEEYYNLLYLQGRYLDLKAALLADQDRTTASPRLSNLLGHAQYNLGSWTAAAEAYEHATRTFAGEADTSGSTPLYHYNAAKAWEKSGDKVHAALCWIDAARGFYSQSAWDDAQACVDRLSQLRFDPATTGSLAGRIAYGRGDYSSAEKIFASLGRKGLIEASGAYLYGLILAGKGRRKDALKWYRKAVELDPDEALYWFRLAETLGILGMPEAGQTLDEALSRHPDHAWTANLAGQAAMQRGDFKAASELFARAAAGLPADHEPAINLSAALVALGRLDEAVAAVRHFADTHHAAANQLGNILAMQRQLAAAETQYRSAVQLAESDQMTAAEYRTNLATTLIEQDRLAEAEEQLRKALAIRSDGHTLMLMADLADETGHFIRAEAAYRSALELLPNDPLIMNRLARHYIAFRKYQKARELVTRLSHIDAAAAGSLLATLERASAR